MQSKRRQILDILKARRSATVEELAQELGITGVTVRHHLNRLRSEELVSEPQARNRKSPGRPEYEYSLTPKAHVFFPQGYSALAAELLQELKLRFDHEEVDAIFEGVSQQIAADAIPINPNETTAQRLERVVDSLNARGYVAHWGRHEDGFVLHTCNCPYEELVADNPELCQMDLDLVSFLLDVQVERVCHMATGGDSCAFLIRKEDIGSATA